MNVKRNVEENDYYRKIFVVNYKEPSYIFSSLINQCIYII